MSMEAREMLEQLLDLGNLTKWEQSFCESLSERLDDGKTISEDQLEKLREIWTERT